MKPKPGVVIMLVRQEGERKAEVIEFEKTLATTFKEGEVLLQKIKDGEMKATALAFPPNEVLYYLRRGGTGPLSLAVYFKNIPTHHIEQVYLFPLSITNLGQIREKFSFIYEPESRLELNSAVAERKAQLRKEGYLVTEGLLYKVLKKTAYDEYLGCIIQYVS